VQSALKDMLGAALLVCLVQTRIPYYVLDVQSALKDMFGAALLVCLARLAAIYVGSWLGCYLTSTMTEFRRLFWMSMVTQVGMAVMDDDKIAVNVCTMNFRD
jgi:hypothetical protein